MFVWNRVSSAGRLFIDVNCFAAQMFQNNTNKSGLIGVGHISVLSGSSCVEEVQVMMVGPHRIQDTEIIFLFYCVSSSMNFNVLYKHSLFLFYWVFSGYFVILKNLTIYKNLL